MIYAEKKKPNEDVFLDILENSKIDLVSKLQKKKVLPNPTEFEALVCEVMRSKAVRTEFEGTIKQTSVAAFPDIIAKGYYGVEVKMTVKDHWRSTGNSVLESLRDEEVEKIYILFGKLGGAPDIKYRLYQECLPSVSVTHSPRYQIDMNLADGHSIFDKLGVSYNELRASGDTIQQIKSYYRSQLKDGEGLWWIDGEVESSPFIKQFRTLTSEEKERFKLDCMVLFPELLKKKKANYERAAAYLITEFGAVSASLRDEFSAGGRQDINVMGKKKSVPQVLFQLYHYAPKIIGRINELDDELLRFYWHVEQIEADRVEQWKGLIDKSYTDALDEEFPSLIFCSGCD